MQKFNSAQVQWTVAGAKVNSVDLGATSTSEPFLVVGFRSFSVNPTWGTANTPVGTLDVQVCNARNDDGAFMKSGTTANWTTLTSLRATVGTDTPPGLQHVVVNGFAWARLVYTRGSGGAGDVLSAQSQGVTS